MATPIHSPLTGEIWHLSIDDLFSSLPEMPRLGGLGPFVINLSASSAPISLPKGAIVDGQRAHVYQIQRTEDHRVRYRLRLGPFSSEDAADVVLAKVRDIYPGALTATADAEDLRMITSLEAKSEQAKPTVTKAPPQPIEVQASPPVVMVPTKPMIPTLSEEMAPPKIAIPVLHKASPEAVARPPVVALPPAALQPPPVAPLPPVVAARVAPPPAPMTTRVLDLATTQTVRALTTLELHDDEVLRWFVIQLSQSEHPFDPEAVPDLDIFSVYRLYSVATIDQGKIMHSLRLGFFGEEMAAKAVSSYLATYYDKPAIRRVSVAERERFANQRLEPRKDVGATGKHAFIEITDERYVREKRGTAAALDTKAAAAKKQ